MADSDEGQRRIHCNSNRIGFLNQSDGWGAYCDDTGNWFANNLSGTNTGDQTSVSGNAGTVGGFTPSATAGTASRVVVADANGYIFNSYFNSTDDATTATLTYIMGKFGDNYLRSATAAKVATFLSGSTMNIAGSSTSCTGNAATATTANSAITAGSATTAGTATNATTATTATNCNNVNIINDTTSTSIHYPMMTNNTTSGMAATRVSSTKISFVPSTGALTCAGNITAFSDESLKTDWKSLPVDFVNQLALIKHGTYTRIDTGERQVGIGAQSLQPLLPEAVIQAGDHLSVAYGNAAMISAVELAKVVTAQQDRISKLEEIVAQLLAKYNKESI